MSGSMRDRSMTGEPFVEQDDDNLIVCRCEEITKGEIRKAVHDGMCTMDEVKRWLRAGMGLCQGMTCTANVKRIVAHELGVSPSELTESTPRAPQRPVSLQDYGNETEEAEGV